MADIKEDVVDTGNVIKAGKAGYIKKRVISPLHEALGGYFDVVDVGDNYKVTYDSMSKLVTLKEEGSPKPLKLMRCTNTDWELFHEEVVAQMTEGLTDDN